MHQLSNSKLYNISAGIPVCSHLNCQLMTFPGNWLTGRSSVCKDLVFADILVDMNTRKTNFWVEWVFNDKLNTRKLFQALIHSIKVSLDVQKC